MQVNGPWKSVGRGKGNLGKGAVGKQRRRRERHRRERCLFLLKGEVLKRERERERQKGVDTRKMKTQRVGWGVGTGTPCPMLCPVQELFWKPSTKRLNGIPTVDAGNTSMRGTELKMGTTKERATGMEGGAASNSLLFQQPLACSVVR